MATTVTIQQAKIQLSRLLDDVAAGQEVIITKAGRPVARLIPLAGAPMPKQLGRLRESISVTDDFDAPLPDQVLRDFEGG